MQTEGTGSSANNDIGFQTKPWEGDDIGLYYSRARYYDPVVGRFITPDPLGFVDGPNLYVFVLNNPVNWVDPYGLYTWIDELVDDNANFAAGMGDWISFGGTDWLRHILNLNCAVDKGTFAYKGGAATGVLYHIVVGKAVVSSLKIEVTVAKRGNVFRIISRKLKRGFRIDPAHHGKRFGHHHRWKW